MLLGLRRLLDPSSDDRRAILAVVGLMVLVRPDGFMNPQLWAENGTVFLHEAQTLGTSGSASPDYS
jgi:hypothetical protein